MIMHIVILQIEGVSKGEVAGNQSGEQSIVVELAMVPTKNKDTESSA
jgi:hypothetical protein